MRPSNIKEPQLDFSKERGSVISLNVNLDDVLNKRTAALDFTGDNVIDFSRENGLAFIEREKVAIAADKSLLEIVRKNFASEMEDSD